MLYLLTNLTMFLKDLGKEEQPKPELVEGSTENHRRN
jgi:hypothetical protein